MRTQRSPRVMLAVLAAAALIAPLAAAPTSSAAATVDRIGGDTRLQTAVDVSHASHPEGAPIVFLATARGFADALSASPAAATTGGPLLLTERTSLARVVSDRLVELAPERVVIVGGTSAISNSVAQAVRNLGLTVERVSGNDRYATSRAIVDRFYDTAPTVFFATGADYPDALSASAAAGSIDAPVLLVPGRSSSLDSATRGLVNSLGVNNAYITGGTDVVSSGLASSIASRVDTVQRLAGSDRYGTSVAINQALFASADRVFLATGVGFADALAGAAYAASVGAPLYLSKRTCVPGSTVADLEVRLSVERATLLGGPSVLTSGVASLTACAGAPVVPDDDEALRAALTSRISSLPGTYSVSVREVGGGDVSVSIRGTMMQEPASVMKLFAAYAILDRVDSGQIDLDEPTRSNVSVGDCLRVVLHVSDNLCHWDLVAMIGQQTLNDQFAAEGYTRTVYQGYSQSGTYYSSKHTTTDDVALLLSRLDQGALLSPEMTALFLEHLETQVWRHRIPSGMPAGIPIANKTGFLWVSRGYIHADTAIVATSSGTFVVAIIGSRNATAAGVRAIGRVVYEHFHGPISSTASFSDRNLVTTSTVTSYRYAGNTDVGIIPAGIRVEAYASARTWYQVRHNGSYVYVHSSNLRNYYDYPRR